MLFRFSKKENNSNKNNSKLTKRNVFCKLFSCVILSLLLTCIACFNFDDYYVYGEETPLYTDNYGGRVVEYYKDKVVINDYTLSDTMTITKIDLSKNSPSNPITAYFYDDDTFIVHTVIFDGVYTSEDQIDDPTKVDGYKAHIKNAQFGATSSSFKPKYLAKLFYEDEKLQRLDFSNFDNSKIVSTYKMFYKCTNFNADIDKTILNLNGINRDINANSMFYGCESLKSICLDIFDNSNNITNIAAMFRGCKKLEKILNIDNLFNSNITDFSNLFYNCRKLKNIDLDFGILFSPTNVRDMFGHCDSLETINLAKFNLESQDLLDEDSGLDDIEQCRYKYDFNFGDSNNKNLRSINLPTISNSDLLGKIQLPSLSDPWLAYKDGIRVDENEYTTLIGRDDDIEFLIATNPFAGQLYSEQINIGGSNVTRHYLYDKVLDNKGNVIIDKTSTPSAFNVVELCDTTKNLNSNRLKVYFYEDETNDIHTAIFEGTSSDFIDFKYLDDGTGNPADQHTQDYYDNMIKVKNVYASLNGFKPDCLNKFFYRYSNIETIDFSNIDTSYLGSLYKLFNSNSSLKKVDFGGKNITITWGTGFCEVFRKMPKFDSINDFNFGKITVKEKNTDTTLNISGLFYGSDFKTLDFNAFEFTKPIKNAYTILYDLGNDVETINMSNLDLSSVDNVDENNVLFRKAYDARYEQGLEEIILPLKVPTNEDYAIALPKNDGDIVWAGYNDDDEYNYEVYENLPAKIEGELTKVVRVDKNLLPEKPGPGPEPDPSPSHKKKKKEENKELEEVKEEVKEDDKEEIKKTIPNVLPTLKSDITPYLEGYDDGLFKPTSNMTRGEFAKVIASFINEYDINNDIEKGYNKSMALSYNDTDESLWSLDAIGFVSRCNLMTGDLNNFNSEDGISRAEVVKVLSLLFDAPDKGYSNTFINELVGEWYEPYFDKFIKAGIVNGYDDGYLRPTEKITRMEVIILLNKLTNKDINNISDLDNKINDLTNRFNDVNKDDWFINELVLGLFK